MDFVKMLALAGLSLQLAATLAVGLELLGERAVRRTTRSVSFHLGAALEALGRLRRGDAQVWQSTSRAARLALMIVVLVAGSTYALGWRLFFSSPSGSGFWDHYGQFTDPYLLWIFQPPHVGGLLIVGVSAIGLVAERSKHATVLRRVVTGAIILSLWPFYIFAGGLFLILPVTVGMTVLLDRFLRYWNGVADRADEGNGKAPMFVVAFVFASAGVLLELASVAFA